MDVTEDKQGIGSAIDIAYAIKKAIKEELNLTASAGVSTNKFVAKIASDMKKPDGLIFIGSNVYHQADSILFHRNEQVMPKRSADQSRCIRGRRNANLKMSASY